MHARPYRLGEAPQRVFMKASESMSETSDHTFARNSSLYQEFLAEREEILKHKWLESEKIGRDVGFERALLDWIRNHRDQWRASRRTADKPKGSGYPEEHSQ